MRAVLSTRGPSPRDWHGYLHMGTTRRLWLVPGGRENLRDGEERLGWVENPSTAFGRQGQVRARMVKQLPVY